MLPCNEERDISRRKEEVSLRICHEPSVYKEDENIKYSSLWKRKVRRDFCGEEIITKSPLSPLFQRGVFSRQ
jgi:hypothetical protein